MTCVLQMFSDILFAHQQKTARLKDRSHFIKILKYKFIPIIFVENKETKSCTLPLLRSILVSSRQQLIASEPEPEINAAMGFLVSICHDAMSVKWKITHSRTKTTLSDFICI